MSAVIAILSGKGGTGKSTAAAALACALCELGRRVVCIDADAELRNLDLCLGMGDQALLDYGDVLSGRCDLSKALTPSADFPELSLLAAPQEPVPGGLGQLLPELRTRFDYCILDYPGGLGAYVSEAAALADRVLVVTTADPCSHRDAERTAQRLRREGAKDLRLIINRVDPRLLRSCGATLDDSMDRVGLQLLGYVPDDLHVPLALTALKPLLATDDRSRRGAAAAFRRIAKRLEGLRVPIR